MSPTIPPLHGASKRVTVALNAINRSIGRTDLYPFVLSHPVVEKLAFTHDLVSALTKNVQAVDRRVGAQ